MIMNGMLTDIHMDVKEHSGEVSDGNKQHVNRNGGKSHPCYKMAKNLVELCSSVLWKVEFTSNKIGY